MPCRRPPYVGDQPESQSPISFCSTMLSLLHLPVGLLALLAVPISAQFPYQPTWISVTNNGSTAYIFSSRSPSSQVELQVLNTSDQIDVSKPLLSTLTANLPFLSSSLSKAFLPILIVDDMNVLAGDCNDGLKEVELWHFTPGNENITGTWESLSLSTKGSTLDLDFLSAGFSFSPTASLSDASLYLFGGMCPNGTSSMEHPSQLRFLYIQSWPTSPPSYPHVAHQSHRPA